MSDRARAGVLLVNLGSPDEPTPAALRRYLAEFLSDRRVVDLSPWLWKPILHGVILRTRPARSAAAYRRIWTESGSPLLVHTRKLAQALGDELGVPVHMAMRYGNPSIAVGLKGLREAGVDRVLVLPLYPQYSATTTATVFDAVSRVLREWRHVPALRWVTHYHHEAAYVEALAESVRRHWAAHGEPQRLLISFHGIPERYARAGDPYPQQCQATAHALAARLGLDRERWALAYQSRFGREPWLQPYADETLERWGREGVARVDVICPGFATDCLETLEEMAMENRDRFLAAGGEEYHYIPALNDRPEHVALLAQVAREHGMGWW